MALISQIPIAEVAALTARALEELLGHDVVLTTGGPALGSPTEELLPEDATRTVVLPFSDGVIGEVTLIVGEHFAMAMEAATPDASLSTAALPALAAGASAIAFTLDIGVNANDAGEIATETLLTSVTGEFAAVPLLENDTRVACVVVRIVDDEPFAAPTPAAAPVAAVAPPVPAAAPLAPPEVDAYVAPDPFDPVDVEEVTFDLTPAADEPVHTGVALHEFQPLGDGGPGAGAARPLTLLNDVAMEVTAELGRRRLKVRDIVGLQPGSVVELDRAAGSPVDVLVNGALVWHGEVVVVDDEFGIRVAEIVVDEN
jgi:flagellar motor switch protein FliN